MDEWRTYFMELLEGKDNMTRRDGRENEAVEAGRNIVEEEDEERSITEEEMLVQINRLKKGKAPGEDDIENEAWKHMTEETSQVLLRLLNKIWKGEGIPDAWRRGVIRPTSRRETQV